MNPCGTTSVQLFASGPLPRDLPPRSFACLDFAVAKRNVGIKLHSPVGRSGRTGFGDPHAVDTGHGLGQGLQTSERYLVVTDFTLAVGPLAHTLNGTVDQSQLAAFDFGQF